MEPREKGPKGSSCKNKKMEGIKKIRSKSLGYYLL